MSMVATAQQTASSITHIQQKIFQPLASTSEVLPTNNSLNAQPIPQSQEQNEQQTMQKETTTMSQSLALPHSSSYRQTQTGYRFKTTMRQQDRLLEDLPEGPGRRLRKNVANVRKHIDYVANVLNHMEARLWQTTKADRLTVQPDILYQSYVLPPASTPDTPVDCVLTKFIRSAMNKVKCPVYSLCWTPEGKRLITGASSGEFTLWNGTAFNFETILQAHDVAIRAMKWSHNDQWLASADHDGFVKYWQPNFNNVHMFQAHKDEPIRSISFCPTDVKLVTGSDDATARIWDFARCSEERVLRGHGADVRSVDWHPTKGLLATGSRDSQQPVKLWDAKTGQCLATLHDHKNSVMSVQWNKNGNWLLTGSRDHVIKLYDVRMMREMQSFRGHKKEVTALAWHPVHEGLFVSGGGDGSLGYWLVSSDKELALLEQAHDQAIWTLEWHPLGHILATGSNDNNTKFWSRNRPGDTQEDIFGMTTVGGVLTSTSVTTAEEDREAVAEEPIVPVIPGMGLDELMKREMNQDVSAIPPLSLPGLGGQTNASQDQQGQGRRPGQGRHQPKRNHRQFERMWTVARPSGGTESTMDDYGPPDEGMADPANYGNNAHGPMDGGMFRGGFYPQQQSLNTPHHQMPPPQHLPPPQHPLPQRPPPHLQMNMKRFPPPRRYF